MGVRTYQQRLEPAWPIDGVRPYPNNTRQGDIGAIIDSMQSNGFFGAVLAQESTGYILAGNHTWQAAYKMGAKTIPVIFIDCDDDTARRIVLADNRTADLADYDHAALFGELQAIMADSGTLMGTGFNDETFEEMAALLNTPLFPRPAPSPANNTAPAAPEETPEDEQEQGQEHPDGKRRVSLSLMFEAHHEIMMRAAETALERMGHKHRENLVHKTATGDYNPVTVGLLAVCVAYLDQYGPLESE